MAYVSISVTYGVCVAWKKEETLQRSWRKRVLFPLVYLQFRPKVCRTTVLNSWCLQQL